MDRAGDVDLLVGNGGALALRALLASAFGAGVVAARSLPMPALVIAYGMYSVVDGIFAVLAALERRGPKEAPAWAYLLVGMSGVGLGLVMLLWGGMTMASLVYLVATSAVVSGLAQLAAALRSRRRVPGDWLLALGGLVAVAFGIAAAALSIGSATLANWIGGYRLVDGAILGALALRLRSWEEQAAVRVTTEPADELAIDVSFEPAELVAQPPSAE